MTEYRCRFCHKLLFKLEPVKHDDTKVQLVIGKSKREVLATYKIEIRCNKCKKDNVFLTPYEDIYKARKFNEAFAGVPLEGKPVF